MAAESPTESPQSSEATTPTPEGEEDINAPEQTQSQSTAAPLMDEANLFYAYAQRTDEPETRFLLTFANARIAREWYQILLDHDNDSISRPSAQLFALETPDLLSRAWRLEELRHLRGHWMYLRLGHHAGVEGGEQAVIPVQNEEGRVVSYTGASDSSNENFNEERGSDNARLRRLEECFERMVEFVEKKTEQIPPPSSSRPRQRSHAIRQKSDDNEPTNPNRQLTTAGGEEDESVSDRLARIDDLLSKNAKYVAALTRKHQENEERLRKIMNRKQERALTPVEDFSHMTLRLEKVEDAVERNSSLLQALLENGPAAIAVRAPHEVNSAENPVGHETRQVVEIPSSVQSSLQELREQSQKQNEMMQNLVESIQRSDLFDSNPLAELLDGVKKATEKNSKQLQIFVDAAAAKASTRPDQEQSISSESAFDFTSLTDRLNEIHYTLQQQAEKSEAGHTAYLSKIQAVTEQNTRQIRSLIAAVSSTEDGCEPILDKKQVAKLRETAEILRDFTKTITGRGRGCEHVVLPPPRKTGKKVVGYVYADTIGEKMNGDAR